ncbi:manganese efflux pump MntP [Anoxybacillus sp. BCO1]|nr:manganese efflux pump MntP [Anoxybacillus sp. BCO1]
MIGEMITLAMMAFALGMDAFSVSLGMGLLRLRLKQIAYIGLTVGFFISSCL